MHVRILSNKVDPVDQARADAALDAFAAEHHLTDFQVVAIYADSEHPLFDQLDSAITLAATEGWHSPNDFDGFDICA